MTTEQLQQLERLALLKQQKAISEREFQKQKAVIDAQVKKDDQAEKAERMKEMLANETPFQRRMRKTVIGLFMAFGAIVALIITFSDKQTDTQPVAAIEAPKSVGIGEIGIVRTGVPGGVSKEAYDAVMSAATAKDDDGIQELISSGNAIYVDNNTKVKVIDIGMFKKRIRLMSGDHKGASVWVPTEFVEVE